MTCVNYEELLAFAGRNPMLSLAFVGLTVAIIVTEIKHLFRGYKALKPAELTHMINAGQAVVIDLSASADFEKGHIVGSRNVQPAQLAPSHKLLADARQSPVVLLCRSGTTAATAARTLKKAGFEQVSVLDGGIAAWQAADLPLVKGRG